MNYNPVTALWIFGIVAIVTVLIIRPGKSWFRKWKYTRKNSGKILIEDILKQMFHIEESGETADIQILKSELKIVEGKLVYMLSRMAARDLIHIEGDKLILSESGKQYALKVVRTHRLWEKYLAENTGFDKSEWHERAEQMEHLLDKDETEKLARKLGNPLFDPHGDPIPAKDGKIAKFNGIPLSTLSPGTLGRIIHLEDEPPEIYDKILEKKIYINSLVKVEENNKNQIIFFSEGEQFILKPAVAENITVEILKEKEENFEETKAFRLSRLKENEQAKIISVSREMRGESRRRLLDLGFVKGTPVSLDLKSPMGDTKAFLIKGTSIALRDDQASMILVKKIKDV